MDVMQLIAPAVILAGLAAFPFFQLIGYKCIQKDDTPAARNWMEWWMYMRLLSTGVLCFVLLLQREKISKLRFHSFGSILSVIPDIRIVQV